MLGPRGMILDAFRPNAGSATAVSFLTSLDLGKLVVFHVDVCPRESSIQTPEHRTTPLIQRYDGQTP